MRLKEFIEKTGISLEAELLKTESEIGNPEVKAKLLLDILKQAHNESKTQPVKPIEDEVLTLDEANIEELEQLAREGNN